jgi:hypothetical protein
MKKCKRILSLALAATMVVGMFAISASAEEEGATPSTTPSTAKSTYPQLVGSVDTPIEELPVVKTVTVNTPGVSLPSETFYLQMAPATAADLTKTVQTDDGTTTEAVTDANGNKLEIGPALTTPIVSYDFSAADNTSLNNGTVKKSDKSFSLTFDTDDANYFNHTGVYRYLITEVLPVKNDDGDITSYTPAVNVEKDYIQYDTTTYYADLYVQQNSSGDYVVVNTIVHKGDETEKPTEITFANKVAVANITISKTISGLAYKNDELFDFYILIPAGGDTITLASGEKIQAEIRSSTTGELVADERTNNTGKLELTVNGDTIEDNVMTYGTRFQLKDGEFLKVYAPVSMIYKVCEADYSAEDYVTTATYTERGDFVSTSDVNTKANNGKTFVADADSVDTDKGLLADFKVDEKATYANEDKIVCVRGTTNDTTNTVAFTNKRTVDVPNSGISVDLIPYVLVMLIAVCGAVLFISKKRRIAR